MGLARKPTHAYMIEVRMNLKILPTVSFLLLGAALMACSSADEEPTSNADESNFVLGKSTGDECSSNWQCGSGLVCRPKATGATKTTCESLGQAGEGCDEAADCVGGDGAKSKTKGTVSCSKGACYRGEGTGGGH